MDSIRQDLLHALRMLRHSPRFVVLVAFILALGIGANTAMFSIAYAWLWRPLAFPNPEQLVSVWRTSLAEPSQPAYFNLYHDYLAWSAQSRSFQSLAATFEQPYDLTGAGDPVQVHGAVASWNLFLTVGATMQRGRGFLAEDVQGGPACIISHALWRERFHSSPSIIGQSITLNRESYRVVGVLPSDFSLRVLDRTFETAVWTLITDSDRRYDPNSASAIAVMGRLNPGTTPEQAQAELSGIQLALDRRFPKDEPENSGVLVVNLQQDNTRTIRESLLLMFAAVALLLLIACANAGSLILGRNSQRAKEFAVRVALGCRATRLFQQLTIEVLVLFTIGGFAGLGIAYAAIRAFVAWNPFAVLPPGEIALSAKVLAATAAILGSAAVIFGSLPAFRSLRLDETDALRSSSAATSGRRQLRSRTLFVVAEISISALLLVGAGLLLSTFLALNSEPLGMRTQDVYVSDVSLPNSRYASVRDQDHFSEMLLNKLRQSPDVRAAGISLSWPYQVNGLGPVELATRHDASIDDMPQAAKFLVSDGYFDALGIPLVRGREFAANDGQSAGFAVINQAMAAKYFAGRDPIGERLRLRYSDEKGRSVPWLIVIGVVGDTLSQRYNQVQWDRYPAVYTSFFQREENPFLHNWDSVELRMYMRGTPGISEREIAAAVHSIDPDLPLGSFRRASDIVGELRSQPRVRATLMSSFGLLTLILAATGIAGIMSQMVEQRRREMGIRIALGAMRSEIVSLVLRRALTLTAIGLLAGLAISAAAGRWLRSFLYDTSALNFKVFGTVIGLLMAVALLAAYLPAQRAAKMDPIDSLHSE